MGDRNTENGRYEVRGKLGEGGQAAVYLVRLKGTSKVYAQKRIKERGERKATEQYILEDVLPGRHRRLANINESFRHSSWHHLYFDYCNVGDLDQCIRRYRKHDTKFPEPLIWHGYKQIAEGLAFIHSGYDARANSQKQPGWQQVIHRDIKPPNILLTFDRGDAEWPNFVIADFGIAAVVGARGFTYEYPWGTYLYQPPERPWADAKADVWALGGCINAMATQGCPPILPMPRSWPNTSKNRDHWENQPESRGAADITPLYSKQLQEWLNTACDTNHKKRPNSWVLSHAISSIATREREKNVHKQPRWAWTP